MASDFLYERILGVAQVVRWLGKAEEATAIECLSMFCSDREIGEVEELATALEEAARVVPE